MEQQHILIYTKNNEDEAKHTHKLHMALQHRKD